MKQAILLYKNYEVLMVFLMYSLIAVIAAVCIEPPLSLEQNQIIVIQCH